MTTIRYIENDEHIWLVVEGHSGYAESGADIVCSAISILTHSFCEFINQLSEEDKVQLHSMTVTDGLVSIAYDDVYGFTFSNLQMLKIGFFALAEQYREYVHLEWGEIEF